MAFESASDRACKTSSSCGSPPSASDTASMVLGSFKSRRVAVIGSSRWWRTSLESVRTSGGDNPSLVQTGITNSAPSTL
ncbi:Uncharacterised protein [Mycobacterium tuberculosis]|uniref:Uncharacterized protein n=2 Tax=Mycobacterium tuberculosis TaxID=1773 RepID=A0A0U0SXW3_MYCTX|nr:Uncharacterised protein [Mycobacterium tuberculosis]COX08400.1 Uncharacterised protein [Mycobacterium tuberculosis]